MTFALARSLLLADVVTPQALSEALLLSATRGTSLVRALLATRAMDAERLEEQLERGDAPTMRHVAPVMSLVQNLPPGLCERLLALPVRRDTLTGTIDVAVVDARDPHPVEEMGHWLRAPVRMVRTSLASMEAALSHLHEKPEQGMRTLAAPIWVRSSPTTEPHDKSRTPAYGSVAPAADNGELIPPRSEPGLAEDVDIPLDLDIPFALTRRSIVPIAIIELGPPAIEFDGTQVPEQRTVPGLALTRGERNAQPHAESDPVLELKRRKSVAPSRRPDAPSPPLPDVMTILDGIRDANDRDTILELLVAGARTAARKVAVLAVKREMLVGWTCSPELGDRSVLRQARVSVPTSSLLSEALKADLVRLVHLPADAAHAPLLGAMTSTPRGEVALRSVKVDGRAVALLLADEILDTLVATRRMDELARVAGEALERLLRDRRKA